MTTAARVIRLDEAIAKFLADLEWPDGVPAPAVDAVLARTIDVERKVEDGQPAPTLLLRFTAASGAPAEAPGDFASPGDSYWTLITSIGTLAEAWCRRHHVDPGTYPTGIKAQIMRRLDMRTAATWFYSIQLAAALASPPPSL